MPFLLTLGAADQPVTIYGSYASGTQAGRYFVAVLRDRKPEVIGQFTVPVGHKGGTFAKRAVLSPGAYTVGGDGISDGDICVCSAKFDPADGSWALSGVDRVLTANLSGTKAILRTNAIGAVGRR